MASLAGKPLWGEMTDDLAEVRALVMLKLNRCPSTRSIAHLGTCSLVGSVGRQSLFFYRRFLFVCCCHLRSATHGHTPVA